MSPCPAYGVLGIEPMVSCILGKYSAIYIFRMASGALKWLDGSDFEAIWSWNSIWGAWSLGSVGRVFPYLRLSCWFLCPESVFSPFILLLTFSLIALLLSALLFLASHDSLWPLAVFISRLLILQSSQLFLQGLLNLSWTQNTPLLASGSLAQLWHHLLHCSVCLPL